MAGVHRGLRLGDRCPSSSSGRFLVKGQVDDAEASNVEDELESQRERFAAILLQGVSTGTITLDEYDFKLGSIFAAQSIAELESLAPWALAPQRNRSRVALVPIAIVMAASLVAIIIAASTALNGRAGAHVARSAPLSLAPVTAAHTSVPIATTMPAAGPVAANVYGSPTGSTVAVVSLGTATRQVTLMTQTGDVEYSVCAGFRVVEPGGGGQMGFSGLQRGAFGTLAVDGAVPCLQSIHLLPAASVPECTSSSGLPGDGEVRWEGFNQKAHSVLYRGVSYGSLHATRWCGPLVVVGPNKAATKMSQIPIGSVVNMYLNGNDWVTGINYCGRQQCYG